MKLSIIVPVYNVEPWLERCLRSLMEQDIPKDEYEIIVVNDGSPDNSLDIVIKLQKEAANIILIDQKNQGVSVARNNGIKKASGEYLLFIDSDDFVKKNSLSEILRQTQVNNLDVLHLNQATVAHDDTIISQHDFSSKINQVFSGPEMYAITREYFQIGDSSVAIIFKRTLFIQNKIYYPADVPFLEDGILGGKILLVAKKCSFCNDDFYFRTIRPGSATNSNLFSRNNAQQGFIKAAIDFREFATRFTLIKELQGLRNHVIAKYVVTSVMSAIVSKKRSNLIKMNTLLKTNGFRRLNPEGLYANKRYVWFYNISFWLFAVYYVIETRLKVMNGILNNKKKGE